MYLEYYGLQHAPFDVAPNPRLLLQSQRDHEVCNHLLYAIQHQFERAGAHGAPCFTRPALWRICGYSHGIPRLINAVCDKALLAGFVAQRQHITYPMVGRAIRKLEGNVRL